MKYKNKLIEVLKNTILLNNDIGLFSKKYDNNIYPESNTYEDIIKTVSPDFIVNSDSIFDRPKIKEISNTVINTSKIKNTPSIKYIESNIKKNINILPTNFDKILKNTENSIQNIDKDTSEYILSNKDNLNHNSLKQEPTVYSKESFDRISPKQESIPDLYTSQQEPTVSSRESFSPISPKQEPTVSSKESFSPISSPLASSRELFSPISLKQESIPDLYTSQQEPIASSRESFSPIENSITPNTFSFPTENQEFEKDSNLYYNNLNSIDKLKSNVFERKLRNGKYHPDITEVNRIKRNLFTDMVGSGLIQSNLNEELQEISAFKYGGTVNPASPTFMINEGNAIGRGTENVSTTIIPANTPNPSISRTPGYSNDKSSLDPETETEIVNSILYLSKKIDNLKEQIPPIEKDTPKVYESNQVRGNNNSIMVYYNSFG